MSDVKVRVLTWLPINGITMESEWGVSRCTADVFEPGALTITSETTGAVLQIFQSDRWRSCAVIGDDGFEQFHFENDRAWQGHVESRSRRSA